MGLFDLFQLQPLGPNEVAVNKCSGCGVQLRDDGLAELAWQSLKTGRVYFSKLEGETLYGPGMELMASEGISQDKLGESQRLLCLPCGKSIEESILKNSTLIACPDCNNSISKRAAVCIHCGCPIAEIRESQPDSLTPSLGEAPFPLRVSQPDSFSPSVPSPKCPTCQSANVEKISFASKAGKVALVGILAIGKVSKTFKCNSCGYEW